MKERPILFSGPMVCPILDGRKTQTRRIAKPEEFGASEWSQLPADMGESFRRFARPRHPRFGEAGDRLWVRETWRYDDWTEDGQPWIRYAADNTRRLCEHVTPEWSNRVRDAWAELSSSENFAIDGKAADRKWRPSIFLPRWASRIALKVTSVRVERLQSISELGALAEGVDGKSVTSMLNGVRGEYIVGSARDVYAALWDDINGDRAAWDSNPWVWAIEFRKEPSS